MLLPDPHAHDYYSLFYLLGFGAVGGLLLRAGYRCGYPWRPWLLLVAGTLLLFILGTKLIAGSGADWRALWLTGAWPPGAARSVLGGLLGAAIGTEALRCALGFADRRVYDAFALPFAVGLAVQGVGCLLAGCCFGTLAGLGAPGVTYAAHTAPWAWQVARGLLTLDAPRSLPVVPVQAGQILLCGLIASGLILTRRSRRLADVPGGQWLLAVGLFAAGRFGLEFWRDGAGDVMGAGAWRGLKLVQWGLAAGAGGLLGALVVLIWRAGRRAAGAMPPAAAPPDLTLPNLLVLAGLLALTAAPAARWLTLPETLVVRALLLPVLVLEGVRWLQHGQLAQPVPLAVLLMAAGLMSQAPAPAPTDSTRTVPISRRLAFTSLELGGLGGKSHQLAIAPPGSCSPTYPDIFTLPTYPHTYSGGRLAIQRSWPVHRYDTYSASLGVHVGQMRQINTAFYQNVSYDSLGNPTYSYVPLTADRRARLLAINPYFEAAEGNEQGGITRVGIGAHIGTLGYDYAVRPGVVRRWLPDLLLEYQAPRGFVFHSSLFHNIDGFANGAGRLGLGWDSRRWGAGAVGGLAFTNGNGSFSTGNLSPFAGENFSVPQPFFVEARLHFDPRWQLDATVLGNFHDVRQFSLTSRYLLRPAGER